MVEDNKETKVDEKKTEAKVEVKPEVKKVEAKPVVKETKKTEAKEEKTEAKVEIEREYIVPMRKGFMNVPHYRRAKKAVKTLKEFMVKHMNIRDGDTRKIKVNIHLNNEIWFRGVRNPLHKIKVKAKKIDGIVYVELADIPEVVGFKIAREAKAAAAAMSGEKKVVKTPEKKVEADADKDGVDDKKEEAEDKAAGTEKAAKTAKVETKTEEHSAKGEHKQKIASNKGLK